jgi:hypothetical protein
MKMEPKSRRDDEPKPMGVASYGEFLTVAGKDTEEATLKNSPSKRMDWRNESRICSRVIVADFLRSMGQQKPWWFIVIYTIDGVDKSELSHLFGYDDTVTLRILDAAGLVQYSTRFKKMVFVQHAWESLFSEFKLTNRINRRQVDRSPRCWWLKVGGDNDMSDSPHEVQDQYNKPKVGKNAKKWVLPQQPRYRVYGLQKTFAKDISGVMTSELLLMLHLASISSMEAGTGTLVQEDDDEQETEDSDDDHHEPLDDNFVNTTEEEIAPDGDDANNMMLPPVVAFPMAAEELDIETYPILGRLFPSDLGGLPTWQLSGLLRDIVNLYKKSKTLDETNMSFSYGNGRNCNLVVVPETNSYANFCKLNREKKWIAQIMKHMSAEKSSVNVNSDVINNNNDIADDETLPSVEWLCRYLATNYETDYLIAAKQAGIPILSIMDAATTSAMAADANLSKSQLRTINRYLTQSCGSRLMVPERSIDALAGVDRMVPAEHGTYSYRKKSGKKTNNDGNDERPESINYWTCSIPDLISREVELMLELQIRDGVNVADGLKSYETISGQGWDVVAGADHGQGAWRSYIKFFTKDSKWRREQADKAKMQMSADQIRNGGYCTKQSAHMECRKDTAELLNATVTNALNEGYSALLSSRLIAVLAGKKVQAVMISKHATGIRVGMGENGKNVLRYQVGNETFITTAEEELTRLTDNDATIILDVEKFNMFVTGDLAFYADVLGKASSSGYWCHLCQLCWAQWNDCANAAEGATKWTIDELKEVLIRVEMETKVDSIMGVKEEMHYKEISPQLFVCPPLHMEIGLVNKLWEEFVLWVDQECELLEDEEIEARQMAALANQMYDESMREQERLKGTVTIELKTDKVLLKLLQKQLKRTHDETDKADLLHRVDLQKNIVTIKQKQLDDAKANSKQLREYKSVRTKIMKTLRKERGKPELSLIQTMDDILERHGVARSSYHGGDFNGVCARLLLTKCEPIMTDIVAEILSGRKEAESLTEEMVRAKVGKYTRLLGCLDATVAGIRLINPTEIELTIIKQAIAGTMKLWRELQISVTTKAHILESHVYDQIVSFRGLGDKAEDFIERGHQEGVADGHRLKHMKNYAKKQNSARKTSQLTNHPDVLVKKEEVSRKAKRKFLSPESERAKSHEARVAMKTIVKSEKRSKFVHGEH